MEHLPAVDEEQTAPMLFEKISNALQSQPAFQPKIDRLTAIYTNVQDSIASIFDDAAARLARVCVVEINLMRLEDRYCSSSTTDQYSEFFQRMQAGELYQTLLSKYPALLTAVTDTAQGKLDALIAASERYHFDFADTSLNGAEPPTPQNPILKKATLVGDYHGPYSTSVAVYNHENRRMFLKARSADHDLLYHELFVNMSSAIGCHLAIPDITVGQAPGDPYYWQKDVSTNSPTILSPEEQNYNLGALITVCDLTGLHDLHFENVWLTQKQAFILDVECGPRCAPDNMPSLTNTEELLYPRLDEIGILPMVVARRENGDRIRWGVMDAPATRAPQALHLPINDGTSEVRLTVETLETPDQEDHPKIPLHLYEFYRGVSNAFHYLQTQVGEQWIARAHQLCDNSRLLIRATQEYGDILRRASFPQVSQSVEDRLAHIQECLRLYNPTIRDSIVTAESQALLNDTVPIFKVKDINPEIRVKTDTPSRLRLEMISDRDIRQDEYAAHVLRTALLQYEVAYGATGSSSYKHEPLAITGSEAPTAAARTNHPIPNISVHAALNPWKSDPMWPNMVMLSGAQSAVQESFDDLYGGTVGEALALLLPANTSIASVPDAGLQTLTIERIRARIAQRDWPVGTGPFNGLAGWVYLLTSTKGTNYFTAGLVRDLHTCLTELQERVSQCDYSDYDFMSGAAGILTVLATLRDSSIVSINSLSPLVENCFSILERTASTLSVGGDDVLVWRTEEFDDLWLGGFSHGVAGVAYGASLWRDMGLGTLADKAWRAQMTLFSPSNGGWLDLRPEAMRPTPSEHMQAWCHGMDGILLASLFGNGLTFSHLDQNQLFQSLRRWIYSDPPTSGGMCHGLASRVESLRLAAGISVMSPNHWLTPLRHDLEARSTELHSQLTSQCHRNHSTELLIPNTGLMLGAAGDNYAVTQGHLKSSSLYSPLLLNARVA